MQKGSAAATLKFFRIVGSLKHLPRTGWVQNGISHPESVADHMYRMTMMSFLIKDTTINRDHVMKICLVHDLAESIVGDITPRDGISDSTKRTLEEDGLKKIVDLLDKDIADEIFNLWLEYEAGTSLEAKIAKQFDKLDMIVQADTYESEKNMELDSFFESTKDSFSHPEIMPWVEELRKQRQGRRNQS